MDKPTIKTKTGKQTCRQISRQIGIHIKNGQIAPRSSHISQNKQPELATQNDYTTSHTNLPMDIRKNKHLKCVAYLPHRQATIQACSAAHRQADMHTDSQEGRQLDRQKGRHIDKHL